MISRTDPTSESLPARAQPGPPLQPVARIPVHVRVATLADLPALDALQKPNVKALGYFPTKQFQGYIEMGSVLIAELDAPVGYCISRDRYLKRDELGVIYQLCVAPEAQRSLIGASLVKAVFDRAAYGCRLFCCWCAQDLAANRFWESMGFVPVAFRAGSTGKRRVHIFWQRRTSADDTMTPWWYPSQTNSGAMREDRLVFPIPPGTHWSEVTAVTVPKESAGPAGAGSPKVLSSESKTGRKRTQHSALRTQHSRLTTAATGLRFGPPPKSLEADKSNGKRAVKPKAPKVKLDPRLLRATRELRDRWLEHVNTTPLLAAGKYDVARALEAPPPVKVQVNPTLPRHLPAAA